MHNFTFNCIIDNIQQRLKLDIHLNFYLASKSKCLPKKNLTEIHFSISIQTKWISYMWKNKGDNVMAYVFL